MTHHHGTSPRRWIVLLGAILTSAIASPAGAQDWTERVFLSASGGAQTTSNGFSDRFTFERFLETARTDVSYESRNGPFFDGGVGFRLWRQFGVGVAVSRFSKDNIAATDSRVPHPFFDDQPREVAGDLTGVARTDIAVHLQGQLLLDPSGPLRVVLFGGPTFVSVEQDLVTEVRYAEEYPFDSATFTTAETSRADGTAIGFNAGADVTWMFHRKIGAGGLVRFTRASVDLDAAGNRPIGIDVGGLQVGAGIRLFF